eukprot:gene29282-36445_t
MAEQWAFDNSNLQPEGKAAVLQQSIKDKHILARVLFVTIIFSVVFQLTHLGVDGIGWWNDCTDKTNCKLAVCIGNAELNLFLLKWGRHATVQLQEETAYKAALGQLRAVFTGQPGWGSGQGGLHLVVLALPGVAPAWAVHLMRDCMRAEVALLVPEAKGTPSAATLIGQ